MHFKGVRTGVIFRHESMTMIIFYGGHIGTKAMIPRTTFTFSETVAPTFDERDAAKNETRMRIGSGARCHFAPREPRLFPAFPFHTTTEMTHALRSERVAEDAQAELNIPIAPD